MLAGLKASIEFRRAVGVERSFNRMRELHAYLKKEVKHVPGAQVLSAEGERFTGAILLVEFPGIKRGELQKWMYETHRIRLRGTGPERLRLSPHIYHTRHDLDRYLAAMTEWQKMAGAGN